MQALTQRGHASDEQWGYEHDWPSSIPGKAGNGPSSIPYKVSRLEHGRAGVDVTAPPG